MNRTFEKARALAQSLRHTFSDRPVGPAERLEAIPHQESALKEQLAKTDLVINATSIGMSADPPLMAGLLTPNLLVYDTVYASGKRVDRRCGGRRRPRGERSVNAPASRRPVVRNTWRKGHRSTSCARP